MTFRYLIMFTNPNNRNQIFSNLKEYNDIIDFDKNFNFINYFIKVENLKIDLDKLFKILSLKVIKNLEIENPSNRNPDINYYYDEECKSLVKKYERFIFEKYDY